MTLICWQKATMPMLTLLSIAQDSLFLITLIWLVFWSRYTYTRCHIHLSLQVLYNLYMSTQQNKFQSNVFICSPIYFFAATLNINDSHGLTIFSGVWLLQPMQSSGEVGDEGELDFHLEPTSDNMFLDRNPSSEVKYVRPNIEWFFL